MQRDENLVYINNGVNGQQIDAVHMGYCQTGAVYTHRSGSVQIHPDRPPISVRARIGSNSKSCVYLSVTLWYCMKMAKHQMMQIMPNDRPGILVF